MSQRDNQCGFSYVGIVLAIVVIGAIIFVASLVQGPSQSSKPVANAATEQAAEAAQYPKSPTDLVQKAYDLALSSAKTASSSQVALSQIKPYLATDFYTILQNHGAKSDPFQPFFCVLDDLPAKLNVTASVSSTDSATVTVEETYVPALSPPDPSPVVLKVITSLQPLKITAVDCPNVPVQGQG